MKKRNRLLAALLAAAMIFSGAVTALAEEETAQPDSEFGTGFETGDTASDSGNYVQGKKSSGSTTSGGVQGKKVDGDTTTGNVNDAAGAVAAPAGNLDTSYSRPGVSKDLIDSVTPIYDVAVRGAQKVTLACVAPYGATVKVSFHGSTYALKPAKKVAEGVQVRHSVTITAPSVGSITDLGTATYTSSYQGNSDSLTSEGRIFSTAAGEQFAVRVTDVSSSVFKTESTSSTFVATAKRGAVDLVTEMGDTMYKLAIGGWISQSTVEPLLSNGYRTQFQSVEFVQKEDGEQFIFRGTGSPIFKAYENQDKLYVQFSNTSGAISVPTESSSLFSSATAVQEGNHLTVELKRNSKTLFGYLVEYKDGATILTCRYKPSVSSGSLAGITIGVDPGHGGDDIGAPGPNGAKLDETAINLRTASAVKAKLESLGAKVVITRTDNTTTRSLDERMSIMQDADVDLVVSLHCNSVAAGGNTGASGVEIYYYENASKTFANNVQKQMVAKTGRPDRGIKMRNFKVTLNSYAPSILVEMGFICNPSEYNGLASQSGMNATANAIAAAVQQTLA